MEVDRPYRACIVKISGLPFHSPVGRMQLDLLGEFFARDLVALQSVLY